MSDLAKKLRIVPGGRIVSLGAPASFDVLLDPLPDGASLSVRASGTYDVVLFFVMDAQALEKGLPRAMAALDDGGVFWICYPKKSSGIKTDLTRDIGWKVVQDAGLGAVTQVAIDETWSALRFKPESVIERKPGSVVAPGAAKKAPAPKKILVAPTDFLHAVAKNDAAGATWKTLAPSHLKEYVTWIEDAKKPETRVRRIEQAVTMLADGVRDRNAKYAGR
jgi:Bacteriocin-protection, YdeI or OmpD-Associated